MVRDAHPARSAPAMTGVLLAGGASRRMGRDKALLEVGGMRLAERVLAALDEVCDLVVVASGDGRRLVELGRPQVADPVAGAGPLAGIVAGLEAAATPLVAVVAVDLPAASGSVLAALARVWDGEAAVVPEVDGRLQPLHAVWAPRAGGELRRRLMAGERGVIAAARALGARTAGPDVWSAADPAGAFARNVNRPEDVPRT